MCPPVHHGVLSLILGAGLLAESPSLRFLQVCAAWQGGGGDAIAAQSAHPPGSLSLCALPRTSHIPGTLLSSALVGKLGLVTMFCHSLPSLCTLVGTVVGGEPAVRGVVPLWKHSKLQQRGQSPPLGVSASEVFRPPAVIPPGDYLGLEHETTGERTSTAVGGPPGLHSSEGSGTWPSPKGPG